jgi:hypothetical protein
MVSCCRFRQKHVPGSPSPWQLQDVWPSRGRWEQSVSGLWGNRDEQPILQSDVFPHVAFAGLFRKSADEADCRARPSAAKLELCMKSQRLRVIIFPGG